MSIEQSTIDKVLELTKLNNTVPDIEETLSLSYKEVITILLNHNTKTIDERNKLVDEINISINTMYDNFKWVSDNICKSCSDYYIDNTLGNNISDLSNIDTGYIIKCIKRNESLVIAQMGLELTSNEIIQSLTHINKIKKSTISKRLTKIQSETTKDKRKLIRLDIEEVINEMYLIYKWFVFEYENCIEINKINKELDEEENNQSN